MPEPGAYAETNPFNAADKAKSSSAAVEKSKTLHEQSEATHCIDHKILGKPILLAFSLLPSLMTNIAFWWWQFSCRSNCGLSHCTKRHSRSAGSSQRNPKQSPPSFSPNTGIKEGNSRTHTCKASWRNGSQISITRVVLTQRRQLQSGLFEYWKVGFPITTHTNSWRFLKQTNKVIIGLVPIIDVKWSDVAAINEEDISIYSGLK